MRTLILIVVLALLAPVAAAQDGIYTEIEATFVMDGGWRFGGPRASDSGPWVLEVDTDGEVQIELFNTTSEAGDPSRTVALVTDGDPSWGEYGVAGEWPAALPVGNAYLTAFKPRSWDIRGTGADSLSITLVSASYAVVSCSTGDR